MTDIYLLFYLGNRWFKWHRKMRGSGCRQKWSPRDHNSTGHPKIGICKKRNCWSVQRQRHTKSRVFVPGHWKKLRGCGEIVSRSWKVHGTNLHAGKLRWHSDLWKNRGHHSGKSKIDGWPQFSRHLLLHQSCRAQNEKQEGRNYRFDFFPSCLSRWNFD